MGKEFFHDKPPLTYNLFELVNYYRMIDNHQFFWARRKSPTQNKLHKNFLLISDTMPFCIVGIIEDFGPARDLNLRP